MKRESFLMEYYWFDPHWSDGWSLGRMHALNNMNDLVEEYRHFIEQKDKLSFMEKIKEFFTGNYRWMQGYVDGHDQAQRLVKGTQLIVNK